MIWQECPRGDAVGQWAAFYVTLNMRGHLVMGRKTYERIGQPKAFLLLFDKTNSRIGLKPASLVTRNAYPVAKHGRHGGKMIRAYRMLQEFGLILPETIQFDASEVDDEGILILDLRTAKASNRARGHRKRGQSS